MLVEGPFELQIIETDTDRELHITFKAEFKELGVQDRAAQMIKHLRDLRQCFNESEEDAERQGIQMMLQVVDQLIPFIKSDEVSLDDPIVLELGQTDPLANVLKNTKMN